MGSEKSFTVSFAFAFALVVVGCSGSSTVLDAGANPPGCRPPSVCYLKGCACDRALTSCQQCDPASDPSRNCLCNTDDVVCATPVTLCVGKGPMCPGSTSRCLAVGSSCASSGGVPPQLVSARGDGGPELEPRCAFSDDVCCTQ